MIKKINYWFALSIVAYIPFYRFGQALLESHTSLSPSADFWLAHWYEPVILILLLINFSIWLLTGRKKSLTKEQIAAVFLLAFGLISILFFSKTTGRGVEGFRFLLLPVAIYILTTLGRLGQYKNKFIKTYLIIAIAMAIWSIVERLFPANYFTGWGILATQDSWYGTQTVVGLKQGVALLGGPNLLAAYLLPAFFLLINKIKPSTSKISITSLLFSMMIFLAIILTFSRSALIGLAIGLFVMFFYLVKSWPRRFLLVAVTLLIGLSLLFAYKNGNRQVKDLFTHGASQSSHQSSLQISLDELGHRVTGDKKALIFGSGLGSAGPAAMKYGDGIVSESWYLQVLLEMGLVGFALWLVLLWFAFKNIWQRGEKPFFFGFLSILVMTAFLHTLSDNPAISFTLFALIALSNKEDYASQN